MKANTLTEPAEVPSGPLGADELRKIDAYLRAANYLSVGDASDRVRRLRSTAEYPEQWLRDCLIEQKLYVSRFGDDMPEVRDWRWPGA